MSMLLVLLSTYFALVHTENYGCMIDAGSSGSRIYVFRWPDKPNFRDFLTNNDEILDRRGDKRTDSPLSSLAGNVGATLDTDVAAHLSPLIQFCEDTVPQSQHDTTPIYLSATAGMRLVGLVARNNVIRSVQKALQDTPFVFENEFARVISGEEEAVFGWVATNTILKEEPRAAVLDLGGASLQVVFEPAFTPLSHSYELVIQEERFRLYAVSFLTWGIDLVTSRWQTYLTENNVLQNPCDFKGQPRSVNGVQVSSGTGDFDECVQLIETELLKISTYCPSAECSFNGNYQPEIPDDLPVYGIGSGWFFSSSDLGCVGDDTTVGCWADKGQRYCDRAWLGTDGNTEFGEISEENRGDEFFLDFCFRNAFTYAALKAFKLKNTREIHMVRDVNGRSAAWALGAMTYELGLWPIDGPQGGAVGGVGGNYYMFFKTANGYDGCNTMGDHFAR